jgi:hypothetical protein
MAHKRWTETEIKALQDGYQTRGVKELATEFGRTRASVYLKANEMKLSKIARRASEPQPAG